MAVSLEGSPQDLTPAYNPCKYYFDSTSKTEDGFRYLVEVYDGSNTTKLYEEIIIPDIDTNYGVLDLSKTLQNKVSYDLDTDSVNNLLESTNSYYNYTLRVGETYRTSWQWDDFGFIAANGVGTITWSNATDPLYNPDGGNKTCLYITSPTPDPGYVNGDTIDVTLNTGTQDRPSIQGVQKVLDVFNNGGTGGIYWTVVLDLEWVGSGTSSGGETRYADNRRNRFEDLLTISDKGVFNSVFDKRDFLSYNVNEYNMEGSTSFSKIKWLSDIPYDSQFTVKAPQNNSNLWNKNLYLQFMTYDNVNKPNRVKFENSNGDVSELTISLTSGIDIHSINVSPARTSFGSYTSGTGPIIRGDGSTQWYDITLQWWDGVNTYNVSDNVRILVDNKDCGLDNGQNWKEILFMDSKGSFLPFNFEHRNNEMVMVDRQTGRKFLGGLGITNPGTYSYSLENGGNEVYYSDYETSFTLRTGYLNNTMSKFFVNSFLKSPITMMKLNGQYERVIIDTNRLQIKEGSTGLKDYEINVTLSNKNMINI